MSSLKKIVNKLFKSKIAYKRVLSGFLAILMIFNSIDLGVITSLAAFVNGLEVSLQWVGSNSPNSISWSSSRNESKIITMQVDYRYNQGASSQGFPINSITIVVPGIGRANRGYIKQADAVIDNLGNDKVWTYTYNQSNDTYVFKNIKEIDKETSFAGSFQIAWNMNSRDTINGYNSNIQAEITANGSKVNTNTISFNFKSSEDTYMIKAEANSLEGPDGLGDNANSYYWVRYSVKEDIAEKAREATNKYYTITLPSGAILKEVGNGEFTSLGNNEYRFDYSSYQTVYIAYPKDKFGGTPIRHDFELHGIYNDTTSDKILAVSDVTIKPNDYGFTYDGYLYWVGKGGAYSDGANAIDKDDLYEGKVLSYTLMAIARYGGANSTPAAYSLRRSKSKVNVATPSNTATNSNATIEKVEIDINEFTGPNYLDTIPFEQLATKEDFLSAVKTAKRQYNEAKSIYDEELRQLELEYAEEMANLTEDDERFGMDTDLVNDLETDEKDNWDSEEDTWDLEDKEEETLETLEETLGTIEETKDETLEEEETLETLEETKDETLEDETEEILEELETSEETLGEVDETLQEETNEGLETSEENNETPEETLEKLETNDERLDGESLSDNEKILSSDRVLSNINSFKKSNIEYMEISVQDKSNNSIDKELEFEEIEDEQASKDDYTYTKSSSNIDNANSNKFDSNFDSNLDDIDEALEFETESVDEDDTFVATPSNTSTQKIVAKLPSRASDRAVNVMNLYLIDDFIDITSSDGTFRQLGDEEYDMVQVTIPSYKSFTNANGFPIQSGKYTAEIVLGTNRNAAAVASFKIDNNPHTYTFPKDTNRFMIRIKNVTESLYINQFDIDLDVKFTLNKNKPIMANGVIRNNDGLIVEYAGIHHNTVFDDSYLGSDANRVRQRDIKTYGTRIQRWYYNYNYESETTYNDIYVGTGTFTGSNDGYKNNISFRSQFRKAGGMKGWSVYSLLPSGIKVDRSRLENKAVDIFGFKDTYGNSLSESQVNNGFSIKITDNYKGSGRTLVEGKYSYNIELDLDYNASSTFNIPIIVSFDDFDKYGSSYVIQAEQIVNNGGKLSTAYATNKNGVDNGSVFNDTLWSDINSNGDVNEPLVYNSSSTYITQVLATQIELKKYVKTPCTDNKYITNFINSTTSRDIETYFGLGYSYKLNIFNSGTPAKNVVMYDTLETGRYTDGTTSQWHGVLDYVDTSEAQKLGLNPVVWYSTDSNPGTLNSGKWTKTLDDKSAVKAIAIDFGTDRIKPSTNIFVEVFMKAPNVNESIVGKHTVNAFNIAYTSFDKNSTLDSNAVKVKLNYPQGTLNVKKVDKVSKENLSGYEFKLINSNGIEVATINDNGISNTVNVGRYTLRETKAPVGYNKANDIEVDIVMGSNEIIVEDPRIPGVITLTKKDISDKSLLEGAEYKLFKSDGTLIKDNLVTNSRGEIKVDGLEWGDYYFEETKAPDNHYLYGDLRKPFTIGRNALNLSVSMENRRLGTATLVKTDISTGEVLSGAKFNLNKSDGTLVHEGLVSDNNGIIKVTDLEWGDYYFEEIEAPDNHYLYGNLRKSFTIGINTLDINVSMSNRRLGTVRLTKKDASDQRVLAGAKFNLYTSDDVLVKENLVSDSNGEVYVDGLVWGHYYFEEIEAPDNHYLYGDTKKVFEINQNALDITLEMENRQLGEVELTKYDADDKVTLVNGAVYELYKDSTGELIGEYITDIHGKISVNKLEWGSYYFLEKEAADGYQINKKRINFLIYKDTVLETVKVNTSDEQGFSSVRLEKYDSIDRNILLSEATFQLQRKENNSWIYIGTYKTDSEGKLIVDKLKYGDYRFIETKAPNGYKLDSTNIVEFSLSRETVGETINVEFSNERKLGSIEIRKVDDFNIAVEGAVFTLYKDNEIYLDNLITDEYGVIRIGDLNNPVLEWGEYILREKSVPNGYKLKADEIKIEVKADNVDNIIIVDVVNERENGSVKLTKYKKGDHSVKVSNAVYRLYDTNGVYIAEKSTGLDGTVTFDNIPWGAYYLQEYTAPEPYMISNEKIRFSINKDNYNVVQELEAEDEVKTTSLTITKKLENDAEDIYEAFGNPSFLYRIVGTDATGKEHIYHRSITLSKDEVIGSVTIAGIPKADENGYLITELNAIRYELVDIDGVNVKDSNKANLSIVADLYNNDSAEAIFTNTLSIHDKYSSTMNAVNMVKKSRRLTYLQVEYSGPDNVTDKFVDGIFEIERDREFIEKYLRVTAFYDVEDSNGNISKDLKYGKYKLEPSQLEGQGSAAPYTYNVVVSYTEYDTTRSGSFNVSAQVERPMYDLTYYNASGKNTQAKKTRERFGTINLLNPEAPEGYTFGGWFENQELTGTSYNGGDSYTNTDELEVNLYAKWIPIVYNINYLDGTTSQTLNTNNPKTYTIETNTITLEVPVKDGYDFDGWTGSNGANKDKNVTIPKGSIGNREYTANFTVANYKIIYQGVNPIYNGSSISLGSTVEKQHTCGTSQLLIPNEVTGLKFNGWREGTASGKLYTPGSSIIHNDTSTVTMWGDWSKVSYKISYNLNGGAWGNQVVQQNYYMLDGYTLTKPKRNGYTFTGWTGSNGSTANVNVTIAKGSTGDKSYTANWTPVNYTITYKLNGGTISGQKTSYNVETANFTLPTPTRKGYKFNGWTGTGLSTTTKTVTINKGNIGNRSYTANWSVENYTITYHLNGGAISGQKTSYNIETANFTLPTPTRNGCTFLGWTGTGLSSTTKTVTVTKGSTGNRSYTANWKANYSELGESLNFKFINLAGNKNNIKAIKTVTSVPAGVKSVEIQSSSSPAKILAYYSANTIYIVPQATPMKSGANSISNICAQFSYLTDISGLSSIDVSNAKNIGAAFSDCVRLSNLTPIANWNTSNVTNMSSMFAGCKALTNLNALSKWNTGKVTEMVSTFEDCTGLTSASGINGWDVTKVDRAILDPVEIYNGFYMMFNGCRVKPSFTKLSGRWNSNGTFIPR